MQLLYRHVLVFIYLDLLFALSQCVHYCQQGECWQDGEGGRGGGAGWGVVGGEAVVTLPESVHITMAGVDWS